MLSKTETRARGPGFFTRGSAILSHPQNRERSPLRVENRK